MLSRGAREARNGASAMPQRKRLRQTDDPRFGWPASILDLILDYVDTVLHFGAQSYDLVLARWASRSQASRSHVPKPGIWPAAIGRDSEIFWRWLKLRARTNFSVARVNDSCSFVVGGHYVRDAQGRPGRAARELVRICWDFASVRARLPRKFCVNVPKLFVVRHLIFIASTGRPKLLVFDTHLDVLRSLECAPDMDDLLTEDGVLESSRLAQTQ
jgi:hypothetical protein